MRDEHARLKPDVVLIEDKTSGTQLIQELVAKGLHAVTRYRPQSDKVMRMHAQTAVPGLELARPGDRERLRSSAAGGPLARRISARACGVPERGHDDQADSTAQFLDWFKLSGREDGIYTYYRMLAEERRKKQGAVPT